MPYTIKKFNGQTLSVIQDGTVDTVSTNIQLPGRNYAGYGTALNQSLVYLLENFANAIEPSNKVVGQLWFDTSVKKIKVYNGVDFKPLASTEYGTTQPSGQLTGDMWYNTTTSQLFVYNGTEYKLIGPTLTNPNAAQLINRRLIDDGGNLRTVLQAVFNNDVMAVFSKDEFNIDTAQTPVNGYTKVYKGITLPSRGVYPNVQFAGASKTALSLLVGTTEIPAANFVQNTGSNQVMNTDLRIRVEPSINGTTGAFTTLSGLFLGSSDNLYLGYNGGVGYISNLSGNGITLSVTSNGSQVKVATVALGSVYPNIDSAVDLGSSTTNKWKNVYANKFYALDDPALAPNNSAFIGRVLGTTVSATEGFVGNITGDLRGDVKSTNGTTILDSGVSGLDAVFTGRTNGPHYGNVFNVNAVSGQQTAVDVSGATTIFRGSFDGLSAATSALTVSGVSYPGFIGDAGSTSTNFRNTVPIRNADGNILASNFIGTAQQASAVLDQNGTPRLASITSAPYTVVIRDSAGNINATNAGSAESANTLGGLYLSVQATPDTIAARDVGGDLFANVFRGTATSARYADLAENYLADTDYEVGTVVMIGGEKEVTACTWGKRAIGVVSGNPAYLMNNELENGTAIALKGRVPVKVIGSIKKGDELIASNDGYAVMAVPHASGVFAIALESSNDTGVKLVECLVL